MHYAERVVTIGDIWHQNSQRTDIVELLKGEVFKLHLFINRVDVFDSAEDLRLKTLISKRPRQSLANLLDEALTLNPLLV